MYEILNKLLLVECKGRKEMKVLDGNVKKNSKHSEGTLNNR